MSNECVINQPTDQPTDQPTNRLTSTHEFRYHPQIFLDAALLPLDQNPKILGVVFDPLFTFSPHVRHVAKKVGERLKIIKALSGTSWGQDAETLLITYKALIKSTLDYAAPVWSPNVKPTPLERLQKLQNAGLRVATGNHQIASQCHLHAETNLLPVGEHLKMLSAQFLASSYRPTHPSHDVIRTPSGPRLMRATLQSAHYEDVCDLLIYDELPLERFNDAKNIIHASYVEDYISNQDDIPVLQHKPPPVDTNEVKLPRAYRILLTQLRSSHYSPQFIQISHWPRSVTQLP